MSDVAVTSNSGHIKEGGGREGAFVSGGFYLARVLARGLVSFFSKAMWQSKNK